MHDRCCKSFSPVLSRRGLLDDRAALRISNYGLVGTTPSASPIQEAIYRTASLATGSTPPIVTNPWNVPS